MALDYVDCKSSNVVYAVICERCRAYVYVEETGDMLYQRHLLNLADPHTARGPGGGALLHGRTQRGVLPRDGVGEASWVRRLPADDGAAMEAEVADIPALWHQHAGVRQCKEMARTLH